ncbi:MAG: LysM peptidoglycan-binding domain-containing protein [Oscillospiraceae bacterium]|jgi:spore germination protein
MLIHTVKSGETLWLIANEYNVPMEPIILANGLANPNLLAVGEALVIPTGEAVHTVRPGETLGSIARSYGVSVSYILRSNSISNPDTIYPGQAVYIPPSRYVVRRGDTLGSISRRLGVPLSELLEANIIADPDRINPGLVLNIPLRQRPEISVNGYIYMLGQQAVPIVRRDGGFLTYLSPFAYLIRENGSLQPIDDEPALAAAAQAGVIPMMAVTNFTATSRGENLASIVLNDSATVGQLLNNIIETMRQKGYRGLNVDFENVLPGDRQAYNSFLDRAAGMLHMNGYFLSTAVAPKTGPEQAGLLYEAHDYPAHGRIADFVILMTYEWGYRKGPPQPISPINEIRRVLDYAISVIPRSKIFFGFQIYARDWTLPHRTGDEAETISPQEAVDRALRYGAEIRYDETAQSPFFNYTDSSGIRHEVWFEDARSAQAKFDAVREYGLAGISYWALGYPFPQNWFLLADNFRIRR